MIFESRELCDILPNLLLKATLIHIVCFLFWVKTRPGRVFGDLSNFVLDFAGFSGCHYFYLCSILGLNKLVVRFLFVIQNRYNEILRKDV